MTGWYPISSAPNTNENILLWCSADNGFSHEGIRTDEGWKSAWDGTLLRNVTHWRRPIDGPAQQ